MPSVTQRIGQIKQPRGGYIKPSEFTAIQFQDGRQMYDTDARKWAARSGLVVDYLSRWLYCGVDKHEAFDISLMGAKIAQVAKPDVPFVQIAENLLSNIVQPLTDYNSVVSALKLVGFDVFFRTPEILQQPYEKKEEEVVPVEVVRNIQIMLIRSHIFFDTLTRHTGSFLISECTFEGGYTATVDSGDGDFCSADTLWDMKCIKGEITPRYTLQILMYYIMGVHSVHSFYRDLKFLGFWNPYLNKLYKLSISSINPSIIEAVSKDVICY